VLGTSAALTQEVLVVFTHHIPSSFALSVLALPLAMTASLLSAPAAEAGIPCVPDDFSSASAAGGTLLVVPNGGGETLAEIGSVVTVLVRDCVGNPVNGYPWQDIWLYDMGAGDISICLDGSAADQNTDANGETTISSAIAGGGYTEATLLVYLAGLAMYLSPLGIQVVSPDINGDLLVNMADLGAFAVDFGSGAYQFRSDLNHDGQINLADVGTFAQSLGASCP
jgi:hypothetical protein